MPNWCTCELEITGDRHDIQKLLVAAKPKTDSAEDEERTSFSLAKLVPMPPGITDVRFWREEHWGTKWDINATVDDQGETVFVKFDSAWSPPIPAIDEISKNYPALAFALTFEEPNMDFFGICKFQNGLQEELNSTYSERFYFNMDFHFSKAHIEDEHVIIPLLMSRMDDPYEFEGKDVHSKCFLKFPVDLDADDIEDEFEESVILSSDDDIMEELSIKREEIINEIVENFEQIKAAAAHNQLNKTLPVKEQSKANRRKV